MGYDMYFLDPPDGEDDRDVYEKANDAVSTAYNELELEDVPTAYFRLNIWGMARCRSAMCDLGMAYDSDTPIDWPEPATDRIGDLAYELDSHTRHWPDNVTDTEITAARAYRDQVEAHLALHPEGGDTIPIHKLRSNDGWIVTPREITAALDSYAAHPGVWAALEASAVDHTYWGQWIAWLRRAVDYGGIRVL